MKKLIIAAALAASALAVAAPASASTYVNISYAFIDDSDVNLGAIAGRAGWHSSTPFGLEAEGSFGVNSGDTAGVKIKLNSEFAAYGTVTGKISDTFDVFARAGYGTSNLKASASGVSISDNFNSWNLGVGANWMITMSDGVRFDYTRVMFNGRDINDDNVWAIGWVHRFK